MGTPNTTMSTTVLPLSTILTTLTRYGLMPADSFLPVSDADLQHRHTLVVVARSSGEDLYGLFITDTTESLMEDYKILVVDKMVDGTRIFCDEKGVAIEKHSQLMDSHVDRLEIEVFEAFAAYNQADEAKKDELTNNAWEQKTNAIISNFVYIGPPNTYELGVCRLNELFMEARIAEQETKNAELAAALHTKNAELEAARTKLLEIQTYVEHGAEAAHKTMELLQQVSKCTRLDSC